MEGQEERVLDEQEWRVEAAAVIQDVRECVAHMSVASLPSSNTEIHFNLTTKEQRQYCVELTASGFRIVSSKFDDSSEPSEEYFETPYALLDKISPLYRESFCSALAAKLAALPARIDEENLEATE
ncbi:GSK3-beta interaction protein-like [Eriocheir sinensis]|uniref:GSK3-beta interaction protein-like n=1 Tax=Eriocheir sinensis TaxID=95602 RepID=UPI0021C8A6B7|nr:GSK3-beta interaction protein-like [Eriocheir sinensis]XP_050735777.1 GSK3-beta interaction protein-like [Eriocheir sinensis]